MGQAKRRGTFEERQANPLGDSWFPESLRWTPERKEAFIKKLTEDMQGQIENMKRDLLGPPRKRVPYRKPKDAN